MPVGCRAADTVTDFSLNPVLLVHGHGMSADVWSDLTSSLVSSGYPEQYIYSVQIRPNKMGNTQAAQNIIAPAANALLSSVKIVARRAGHTGEMPTRIDIVSHSMGAVSSRWYLARISPHSVRTWISIGGANHGTNALCAYQDDGAKEMCPAYSSDVGANKIQVLLNGSVGSRIDESPWGIGDDPKGVQQIPPNEVNRILYFTIRLQEDEWIDPSHSAEITGAGAGQPFPSGNTYRETSLGNFLIMEDMRHDDMPWHDDVIALVHSLLSFSDTVY